MEEQSINFTLRMPRHILEKLDEEAARERRSRTGHINAIFEERYGMKQTGKDVEEQAA